MPDLIRENLLSNYKSFGHSIILKDVNFIYTIEQKVDSNFIYKIAPCKDISIIDPKIQDLYIKFKETINELVSISLEKREISCKDLLTKFTRPVDGCSKLFLDEDFYLHIVEPELLGRDGLMLNKLATVAKLYIKDSRSNNYVSKICDKCGNFSI